MSSSLLKLFNNNVLIYICRSRAKPVQPFSTTVIRTGLEEFFPKTENIIEESEKTGRPWKARELRHKSNEDLHKLWYVLLKERNMLLTMKQEAKRQGFIMPAPERLNKVKFSMAKIKLVVSERAKAIEEAKRILREEKLKEEEQQVEEQLQVEEKEEGTG